MDLKIISELVKLVSESKLTSLEVEEKELRIKLEKNITNLVNDEVGVDRSAAVKRSAAKSVASNFDTINVESTDAEVESKSVAEDVAEDKDLKIVKAPIVGTFYASSSPESAPFATKGKRVAKGDTLCIIEAMKLMNEIESEFDGEIVDILVENGAVIEYGQPLFKIK